MATTAATPMPTWGVEMVAGGGFVTTGKWVSKRHESYKHLMKRIQQVIAVLTLAENDERSKAKQTEKVVLGYDPEKWTGSNLKIYNGTQ